MTAACPEVLVQYLPSSANGLRQLRVRLSVFSVLRLVFVRIDRGSVGSRTSSAGDTTVSLHVGKLWLNVSYL